MAARKPLGVIPGIGVEIKAVDWPDVHFMPDDGCIAYIDQKRPCGIGVCLSDETKARLAHLEAIEAAMKERDDQVIGSHKGGDVVADDNETAYWHALHKLHDLIRRGMKDNG